MKYIALLRGINIGGHTVTMENLRAIFAEMGLKNIRSYIQTGNIFFDSTEGDREILTNDIEKTLKDKLGYEVAVFLRTPEELEELLEADPFHSVEVTEDVRLCIVFLPSTPPKMHFPLVSTKQDWEVIGAGSKEVFIVWRIINGRPPSNFSEFNKIFGTKNTSRFFHTTKKILEAAVSETVK